MNEYSQRNMPDIVNHRKFYKLGLSSLEGCLVHRMGWAERSGTLLKLPSVGIVEMALWVKDQNWGHHHTREYQVGVRWLICNPSTEKQRQNPWNKLACWSSQSSSL